MSFITIIRAWDRPQDHCAYRYCQFFEREYAGWLA